MSCATLDPRRRPDAVESGELELSLDAEQLREFVERAEAGVDPVDPGLEATVRIARALLDNLDDA